MKENNHFSFFRQFLSIIFATCLAVLFLRQPLQTQAASGIWGTITGSSLSEYNTAVSNINSKLVPLDSWGSMSVRNGNTFYFITHTIMTGTCRHYTVEGKVLSPTGVLLADEYDPLGYNTTCSGSEAYGAGSMFMLADATGKVTAYFKTYTQPYMSGPTYYYRKQDIGLWVWGVPTLTASLSANPASGVKPLNSNLVATVGGNSTGTINYSFWWNCNNAATTYAQTVTACGDPHTATIGAKFDGVTTNPKNVYNNYASAGTFTPKVIVERGSLSAESRSSVTVNNPLVPTATLTANGSAGSITIGYNTSATLAWTSANATSCSAAWTGSTATAGSQSTGNLVSNQSYSMTCTGPGGNVNVNVNVNVIPPTLAAGLSANPTNSEVNTDTTLSATAGGTAIGTMNYSFWWNCNDAATTYAQTVSACGDPHTAAIGAKFDNIATNPKDVLYKYQLAGAFTPKVIIERDSLSAESRSSVTVTATIPTGQTLTAALTANPPAGSASAGMPFEPTLTAAVGGTATGTINYTFWWNCNNTSSVLGDLLSACGDPRTDTSIGSKKDNQLLTSLPVVARYEMPGTYTAKVFIERGTAQPAIATAQIIVVPYGVPASVRVDVEVEWDERGKTQTVNYEAVLENLK